jgi:hypothetical protein
VKRRSFSFRNQLELRSVAAGPIHAKYRQGKGLHHHVPRRSRSVDVAVPERVRFLGRDHRDPHELFLAARELIQIAVPQVVHTGGFQLSVQRPPALADESLEEPMVGIASEDDQMHLRDPVGRGARRTLSGA